MTNTIIPIVYTPTNEDLNALCVSMQSVIENNYENELKFTIITDENFDKKNIDIIKSQCKKYKNITECEFKFINSEKYKYLKHNSKIIYQSSLYLYDAIDIVKYDKFLFLHFHVINNTNLEELYNTDIKNYVCAAAEYINQNYISKFNVPSEKLFTTNVMLINKQNWMTQNISEKFFSFDFIKNYNNYDKIPAWITFNYFIHNVNFIDYKFDYAEEWWASPGDILHCSFQTKIKYKNFISHIESPVNLYVPDPTTYSFCTSYLPLWWSYAEKTPIYNKIKDFRQLNKYKLSATSAQNSFDYFWLLSRIYPYIKPFWFRILLGFAISIPLGLLDGVTALALKPYMDYVVGGKSFELSFLNANFSISSMQMAYIIPIGIVLFAGLQGVLRYLNDYISAWTSSHITNNVKIKLFEKLIHMHPQFYDDNSSGIVISRYMGDPGAASAGIVDSIKTISTALCGALGLIAVMLYSSWKLAFIGVLVLCIAFIPVALIRKRIKETSNKNMIIGGKITTNINETYSGSKVIAAYGLQNRQKDYFNKQIWKSYDIGMSLLKRAAWMSPMMYLIASIGIAIVMGYGTYLINSGQMTSGAFASFVTSLLLLYKPVKTLGNTLTGVQNIFVAMGRIFELFDLDSNIVDCENPKEMKGLNSKIEFKNVYFEYIPNKPILKNINLTIPKNETIAIVGNSGGGKSTLVNLIPRFYDIKNGTITFDGMNIKEFSLDSLRKNISVVFQDNFLFTGTIKENILMGKPDATTEELMAAIKAAHLEDMINELPEGLDTELGERGLTLSGGQRQRVAIARAMLRNAPIVILDEATSALDNESEAIVQKAMDNLMKDRTVFIIAHRLSTIKNADRIAVINEGELVELGTHDELINIPNGQYRALYEMQFKKQTSIK